MEELLNNVKVVNKANKAHINEIIIHFTSMMNLIADRLHIHTDSADPLEKWKAIERYLETTGDNNVVHFREVRQLRNCINHGSAVMYKAVGKVLNSIISLEGFMSQYNIGKSYNKLIERITLYVEAFDEDEGKRTGDFIRKTVGWFSDRREKVILAGSSVIVLSGKYKGSKGVFDRWNGKSMVVITNYGDEIELEFNTPILADL